MAQVNPVQVEKYLKGVDYPARKQDLIKTAEKNGADKTIRDVLSRMPDQEYDGPTAVSKAIASLNRGQ